MATSAVLQLAPLLQPLLAALNNGTLDNLAGLNGTILSAVNGTTENSMAFPTDISSIFHFIYSFGALRDWLKLIVIGGALEMLRRLYYHYYSVIIDSFYITATFESEDQVFTWMLYWLASLPQLRTARTFTVRSSVNDYDSGDGALEEEDESADGMPPRNRSKIFYLPSYSMSYNFWYKRRRVTVSRAKEESRWWSEKSTLHITILTRNRAVLDSMILEAKRAYMASTDDKIGIYVNQSLSSDWRYVASRPKRPMTSIILDAGVKELILDDARDFMKSKQWYSARGIPFRRGYLLYGAPGSGKTSIIHSLAGELGLDIYIISLSKSGLDDTSLNGLICALPEQCIALMEDIDAAFTHGLTRETVGTELEDPRHREGDPDRDHGAAENDGENRKPSGGTVGPGPAKTSGITLSGLLNALDGVSAQEGRLLFATTNRYSVLDPALTRPGRMDLHVEFRLASRYQAREMFRRFYIPDNATSSEEDEKSEGSVNDSGYATPTKPVTGDLIDLSSNLSEKPSSPPSPTGTTTSSPDEPPNYIGLTHSARAPSMTKTQIDALATRFADTIPEREFSMASLQGYLMTYKIRPVQAVEDIERWVHAKMEERKGRVREVKPGKEVVIEE